MKLLFLHGFPGVGKLTVGRYLQEKTGFRLFHNHLVVDTLLSVFPFGSDAFVRLREQSWLSVFEEAALAGVSCIFTFAPEKTVRPSFIDNTRNVVRQHGGSVYFVELVCDAKELMRRIEEPSRRQFGKLQSVARLRELEREGAFHFPKIESDLVFETTRLTPEATAQGIAAHFDIPKTEEKTQP